MRPSHSVKLLQSTSDTSKRTNGIHMTEMQTQRLWWTPVEPSGRCRQPWLMMKTMASAPRVSYSGTTTME